MFHTCPCLPYLTPRQKRARTPFEYASLTAQKNEQAVVAGRLGAMRRPRAQPPGPRRGRGQSGGGGGVRHGQKVPEQADEGDPDAFAGVRVHKSDGVS